MITQSARFLDRNGGIDSGLTTTYATPKATSPANRPASRPLTRKLRAEHRAGSVAGEAEQVPTIVHPLMDSRAGQEGAGTLLRERKYIATSSSMAAKISQGAPGEENGGAATATGGVGDV